MKKNNNLRLRIFSIMMLFVTLTTFSVNAQTVPNLGDKFKVTVDKLELNLEVTSNTKENVYEVKVIKNTEKKAQGNVVIPETVKHLEKDWTIIEIGGNAFNGCTDLYSISFPNTVKKIGGAALGGCLNLKSVHFGSGLEYLHETSDVFGTSPITAFTIEESNPNFSVEDGILFNKDKSEVITCPSGKTGDYVIPNSVKTIGMAFEYTNLTSVTIPNSVTKIAGWAFYQAKVKKIISKIETPFAPGNRAFKTMGTYTLVVPKGTKDAYSTVGGWYSDSDKIEEAEGAAAVNNIVLQNPVSVVGKNIQVAEVEGQKVTLFNLSGKMIFTANSTSNLLTINVPSKGVYLLQVNNQSRKVLVK